MHSPYFGLARGTITASAVYAVAWLMPTRAHAQQNNQDSAAARGNRNMVEYQYVIDNGPGQSNNFRLEVKQTSPNTPPVITVNGRRVDFDSTGSKRIDLPDGGHITVSRGNNGQVTIQDGNPNRLFALNSDVERAMRQAEKEFARVQAQMQQQFGRMPQWPGAPDTTVEVPAPCNDSSSTPGVERE